MIAKGSARAFGDAYMAESSFCCPPSSLCEPGCSMAAAVGRTDAARLAVLTEDCTLLGRIQPGGVSYCQFTTSMAKLS